LNVLVSAVSAFPASSFGVPLLFADAFPRTTFTGLHPISGKATSWMLPAFLLSICFMLSVGATAFFEEASATGPNVTISSAAAIGIKDPLFRISLRIDPPIGAITIPRPTR
jgi:hypothetical protein